MNLNKKELLVSSVANILVWYNFALFMPFLPILSEKFFPIENINIKSVITFLTMSSALFVRPIGSILFGPIGDKIGREKALSLSILLMAIPTFCIGLLPTYEQIGLLSPILLIVFRILQGIAMGGEYTAAMVHLVEIAPNNKRGFFGALAEGGSHIGVILSGKVLLILYCLFSETEIYQYAWRIPFFIAVILIPFAFVSSKSTNIDKPTVNNVQTTQHKKEKQSIINMLSQCKKEILCTIAITSFSGIGFYALLSFLPYYLVREGILTLKTSTMCSVVSTAFIILATFGAGFLSDYFSRKLFIKLGIGGVCATMCAIFFNNIHSEFLWISLHAIYGFSLGTYFGGRSAFFVEAFPKKIRCTAVSISLNIAQAIFGGSSALIMNYCTSISKTTSVLPILLVALAALLAISKIEDRTGKDLI